MFEAHCPHCRRRVLLTSRHLVGFRSTREGHWMRFRCWCGGVGDQVVDRRLPVAARA